MAWAQDAPAPLTVQATQQLRTLAAFKAARTPTQQKVSGSLLLEAAIRRGDPIANAVPLLQMRVPTEADGLVLVDIDTNVTGDVLATIADLGGIVVNAVPRFNAVRARLPFDAVELVAARAEVRSIRPADRAYTNAGPPSEGDVAHLADQARSVYGVDGTGVTVGVLSDSVDSLATLQASGDLPPACPATPCSDVLPGQSGGTGTSEGTAMMEIVHDLAGGADILFATAVGSQAQFAQNILDLLAAGADVIVDDEATLQSPSFRMGSLRRRLTR